MVGNVRIRRRTKWRKDSMNEPSSHLLAEFCASLPQLRRRAEEGFWTDTLNAAVRGIAAGRPVTAALRDLGLLPGSGLPTRGEGDDIAGAVLPGLAPVALTGHYRCPTGQCARRGERDGTGRPPVCHLTGVAMAFREES
jgi:hypothetical protein